MSHEIQIRSGDPIPEVADPLHRGGHPEQVDSVFARIHHLLRGRYVWAITLGSIFAAIGGFAGYKSTEPLWTCTGMIQIKMDRDVVLSNAPENQNTQSPEVIKETQIALMRHQRIISSAMGSIEWVSLHRPLTDESIADFIKKLTIASQGRSEIINVSFVDPDPAAASAAVKGVLAAYNGVYIEGEFAAEKLKRALLESRKNQLTGVRDQKRDEIDGLANNSIGADDLRAVHQANVAALTKLSTAMEDLTMTISSLEGLKPGTTQPVRKPPAEMTLVEIEQADGGMRQLRRELVA